MVKKLLTIALLFALFLSFVSISEAQSVIDESLTINADIGQYKYSRPYTSGPHLSEEDKKTIDAVGLAIYNKTIGDSWYKLGGIYTIQFRSPAIAEQQFSRMKSTSSQPLTQIEHKGNSLYFMENFEGGQAKFWQSGRLMVIVFGAEQKNGVTSRSPVPEEVLDAYLDRYPVNYFKCEKMFYTQEMPPDGYQYVYDYDDNGCEKGRHLEPITQPTQTTQPTPYPVATATAVPVPIKQPSGNAAPETTATVVKVPLPVSTAVPISGGIISHPEAGIKDCSDSDGGQNYYQKGTATAGINLETTDFCGIRTVPDYSEPIRVDSCEKMEWESGKQCTLYEGDCGEPPEFRKDSVLRWEYECPNGCSNGVCIGGPQTPEASHSLREIKDEPLIIAPTPPSSGLTGRAIGKVPQEDVEKAAGAVLKLENVKIDLSEARGIIDKIAGYYRGVGDSQKTDKWAEISSIFGKAVDMVDSIIQYLKATRDVEGARSRLADLRSHVNQISEKILSD